MFAVVKVSSSIYEIVSVQLVDGMLSYPTENGSSANGTVYATAGTVNIANTVAKSLNQYFGYGV